MVVRGEMPWVTFRWHWIWQEEFKVMFGLQRALTMVMLYQKMHSPYLKVYMFMVVLLEMNLWIMTCPCEILMRIQLFLMVNTCNVQYVKIVRGGKFHLFWMASLFRMDSIPAVVGMSMVTLNL